MILIDISANLHRVLYMNLNSINDNPEFLSHLLVSQIVSLANKFGASKTNKCVICMDNKSWRKQFYNENKSQFPDLVSEEYKGQRKRSSEIDWKTVFSIFEETMQGLKDYSDFFVVKTENAEADDVIAVLTKEFKKTEDIWILSGDKDFIQLQDIPRVNIFDPMKQQFRPDQDKELWRKIHILVGDVSDNIKSVRPRLGEKTAVKMLKDLDDLLATDANFRARYKFNETLIDFDFIPDDIQKSILAEYNEQKLSYDSMSLLKLFMKFKLAKHAEDIGNFALGDKEKKTKLNTHNNDVAKIKESANNSLEDFFS